MTETLTDATVDRTIGDRTVQVDTAIVDLVDAMNRIPGLRTEGCCGGHEDPQPCQRPIGEFYINFSVTRDEQGWKALDTISEATIPSWESYVSDVELPPGLDSTVLLATLVVLDDWDTFSRFCIDSESDGDREILTRRINWLLTEATCGFCNLPWKHEGPCSPTSEVPE